MIVLTGIAGLIAGAFSMATGEYISVSSQNELTQAEVELERRQHARDPEGKLAAHRSCSWRRASPRTWPRRSSGRSPPTRTGPSTRTCARNWASTPMTCRRRGRRRSRRSPPSRVGALIPLSPFLLGYPVLKAALVLSGLFAFVGGAAVGRLTGRSPSSAACGSSPPRSSRPAGLLHRAPGGRAHRLAKAG